MSNIQDKMCKEKETMSEKITDVGKLNAVSGGERQTNTGDNIRACEHFQCKCCGQYATPGHQSGCDYAGRNIDCAQCIYGRDNGNICAMPANTSPDFV